MPLPGNATKIVVRGRWFNARTGKGVATPLTFDPVPLSGTTTPNVTDLAEFAWIKTQQETVVPDADTGYYAVALLANDDPDLTAFGGWRVTPQGETPFVIAVSVDSPTVTVDAAMKAAIPDLVVGEQVQAMWLTEAALVDTIPPPPPTAWLTADATVSTIATAVGDHDEDPQAHQDIRDLIGTGGGGGSSTLAGLTDVDSSGAAVGQVVAVSGVSGGTPSFKLRTPVDAVDLRDWSGLDLTGASLNDTIMAQAVAQTPEGGTLLLPRGTIAVSDQVTIDKSMTVQGVGCYENRNGYGTDGLFDMPGKAPYIIGSVILQTGAGKHGIAFTGTAKQNNLSGLGIRFDDPIRWINTGHGVYAAPTATYNSGHEHGIVGATWDNVYVFGHDGNHYGAYMLNELLCTVRGLRSWGGGVLNVACDSYAGNYGNLVVEHPYGLLLAGGSAHGYSFQGRTSSGTSGVLNLITLLRPQCNSSAVSRAGVTAVTNSQYLFRADDPVSTTSLAVINPDFECGGSLVNPVAFGGGNAFVDPSGVIGKSTDMASKSFGVFRSQFGARRLNSDMTFSQGNTPAPTAVIGAGAGTGSPTVTVTGNDLAGTITLTTGTDPTSFSDLCTITFGQIPSFSVVALTARNGNAAAVNGYVRTKTTNTFVVGTPTAPTANQTYIWDYVTLR